jgi:hypothetical protein
VRISGAGASLSHLYGMSSLWHDVNYIPEKELAPPLVTKGLEDMPLPTEQHQVPAGEQDPYALQEKAYDVAHAQMERGKVGQAFLHGKNTPVNAASQVAQNQVPPAAMGQEGIADPAAAHALHNVQIQTGANAEATMTLHKGIQKAEQIHVKQEIEKAGKVAQARLPASAVETATRIEAEKMAEAAHMGDAVALSAGIATMGAGQVAQAATMPAVVSEAASVVGAAASAANTAQVGMTQALGEDPDQVVGDVRRHMARKRAVRTLEETRKADGDPTEG